MEKNRKISPLMDLTTRLDFCSFNSCWLNWLWLSWSVRNRKSPQNTKVPQFICSGSGGNAQVPLLSWGVSQWMVWGCRSQDTSGVSHDPWHLPRCHSCLSCQHGWVNYGPSEGVNTFRQCVNVPVFHRGEFSCLSHYKKGIDMIKITSSPANSQDLHLTSLLPYLFRHPAVTFSDECVPSAPGWSNGPLFESSASPVSHTPD